MKPIQTKKMSHMQKLRNQRSRLKLQVQNVLHWDELQYARYQQDQGLKYLQRIMPDVPFADQLPQYREFWSWWIMHYMERDQRFLKMAGVLTAAEHESYYHFVHDVKRITRSPHSRVLETTYHQMIHRLVKRTVARKEVQV